VAVQTIAGSSPGNVGRNVGKVLKYEGPRIMTRLVGRRRRTVAEGRGVPDKLPAEPKISLPARSLEKSQIVPPMPLDAGRRIGEMHEIAATLGSTGATPNLRNGPAAIFETLVKTPVAIVIRETVEDHRTLRQAVEAHAAHPSGRSKGKCLIRTRRQFIMGEQ
jgi:hypothetical protein